MKRLQEHRQLDDYQKVPCEAMTRRVICYVLGTSPALSQKLN